MIVGCIRLLGFNVFRNTYKPLLAESIVEFWNRYYYYFKELLVEFFFYPTYLRSSWARPGIRMFLAVFAAAFIGNMYYHVLGSPETVLSFDLAGFLEAMGPKLRILLSPRTRYLDFHAETAEQPGQPANTGFPVYYAAWPVSGLSIRSSTSGTLSHRQPGSGNGSNFPCR